MEKSRSNNTAVFDTERLVPTYFHLTLPVVMGSIVTILYNLADTSFVAQTGDPMLVAGVSLCSPLFTLLMAFGNVFGQGGSSLISRLMGRGDEDGVKKASSFCFWAAILVGAALAILLTVLHGPAMRLLGASGETLPHASGYYTVLVAGAPFIVVNFVHLNLLRCEGMASRSMVGTLVGAGVNIVLDPILISICGLGAQGAALATVIGYLAGDVFFLIVVRRRSRVLSVNPQIGRIGGGEIRDILSIGLTAAITNAASSVCIVLLNRQLVVYGADRVAAMGISLRVSMIATMMLVGFSFGGVPLFGYLNGAGDQEKQRRLTRFCLLFVCSLALALTAGIFLLAPTLMRSFIDDAGIVSTGTVMLRRLVLGNVFGAVVMLLTCIFQAGGRAVPALVLSLSRQGVIFIAVLAAAAHFAGYDGILFSQAIADVLSAALGIVLYRAVIAKN